MIGDSVAYLLKHFEEVIYDAEHFFDGFKRNREYALATLQGRRGGGRPLPRPLRHQRRRAAARGRRDHPRGAEGREVRDAARHPRPQRRRVRRRQLAGGRGRGRRPRPGHDQRLRRALRQRQPGLDHPEPDPQDGPRVRSRATNLRELRDVSRFVSELANRKPWQSPALRRRLGLRPQGRHPRLGRAQASRDLRAHRPGAGGQPPAGARLGAGRAVRTSSGRPRSTGSTWTRTRPRPGGSSRRSSGSRTRASSSRAPRPRSSC